MTTGTVTDMRPYLRKAATYRVGDLHFRVEILDVKNVWGRNRYLITPVSGHGSQWVEDAHLTFDPAVA